MNLHPNNQEGVLLGCWFIRANDGKRGLSEVQIIRAPNGIILAYENIVWNIICLIAFHTIYEHA